MITWITPPPSSLAAFFLNGPVHLAELGPRCSGPLPAEASLPRRPGRRPVSGLGARAQLLHGIFLDQGANPVSCTDRQSLNNQAPQGSSKLNSTALCAHSVYFMWLENHLPAVPVRKPDLEGGAGPGGALPSRPCRRGRLLRPPVCLRLPPSPPLTSTLSARRQKQREGNFRVLHHRT